MGFQNILPKIKNHSYYALINGYKPFFLKEQESDLMIDFTRFEHLYACKLLEMDISSILLKYVQIIEQGFRSRVAYIISREFGTDDTIYPCSKNYTNTAHVRNQALQAMQRVIDNPHTNSYSYYFKHLRNPVASIPPWIAIQDMEFHKVIQLYQSLKVDFRNEIRADYLRHDPTDQQENIFFSDSINFLRDYRNTFAHSKRNFNEKIYYSLDKKIFQKTVCFEFENQVDFDSSGKTKSLYPCILLIISYLQDPFVIVRMVGDLLNLFMNDNYIDGLKDLNGNAIFNGKTVYNILGLPNSFLRDLTRITTIPSKEIEIFYS